MNDIALLRLGMTNSYNILHNPYSEERVDLSVFSPACFPSSGASFVGQEGHVYGEKHDPLFKF